ncbi:hypothetical protein MTX26_34855 (plasmid) [Bradyrhizobium sp. ISRA443]|uniref:hypothetical protein n=1 Tax=unclassified Bradyrhizobium TaxID=2631580 RepID=UPI002479E061|nr:MULTISPECIES: hypothetical protein [unclassified Bradyrhizobium]WGR90648.1 hypothetical protein MTX20_00720 [Bradyrhizobium sp. ISRA435]WGS02999.1 hypothetical protein MTX23_35770 [Bradyrhizobium sp. ISRA436]WGS09964.1 hypothetical protein MTX18_34855 [Bradyrhizobium sp. ISRA437]WGS16849.1 hypothetical protein MTX26_34855 [Bradyrhizobium sp. ISRA443]
MLYQISKNCRTNVEMIEKCYGSHIKNQLSAAAINVARFARNEEYRRARRVFDQASEYKKPDAPASYELRANRNALTHLRPWRQARLRV